MSAFTAAVCYRAGGEPPVVTAGDLAVFVERILALDILAWERMDVRLKFGRAIDQDDHNTTPEEQVGQNTWLMLDYDWHVKANRLPHAEALELLRHPPASRTVERTRKLFGPKVVIETFDPHIYRARLSFGMLKEPIYRDLCHKLEGNYLNLTDLTFSIDVVELIDPEEGGIFQVGWMDFSISGSGYLFPWSYAETMEKLRAHRELGLIRDFCRELWSASTQPVRPELVKGREQMGKLWSEPYDAPYDWYWAINETY